MKVVVLERHGILHLEPEHADDVAILEQILQANWACGFGKDPHTGRVIHTQVKTKPQHAQIWQV